MDWNKTKSLFIIVFAILNVFLYSLYLDRYTEAQNVTPLGTTTAEEKLAAEDITYPTLSEKIEEAPYVTGKMKTFIAADVPGTNLEMDVENENQLTVEFDEPLPLSEKVSTETLTEFVGKTVFEGTQYGLWEIDEKQKKAVFFQKIDGKPLFYSNSGLLILHWDENNEVIGYEQTIYEKLEAGELKKNLVPAIQAIHTLYQRRLLQANTTIDEVVLGYSEYVTVSENTQMFLPTWRISATLEDGSKEEHFVNAVKDGVIEMKKDDKELVQ